MMSLLTHFNAFILYCYLYVGAREAQPVKAQNYFLRVASWLPSADAVFPWYRLLANLLLQFASVVSDHHCVNIGGPNQWTRVQISSPIPSYGE